MLTKKFVDKGGDKKVGWQKFTEVNKRLTLFPAKKFDGDFWG
jgi:hypothetical protein